MKEKEYLESWVKKDYGIDVEFPQEVDSTDTIYIQIYGPGDSENYVKSCTEFENRDHDLRLQINGYYECFNCGRVFEKLLRAQPKLKN